MCFHYYSDAIRVILVHRFGGWYSDLDMVFLRPFNKENGDHLLKNVVAADDVDFTVQDANLENYNFGSSISNALFHNDAGHIFLETVLTLFNSTFSRGQWASGGPLVFNKAFEEICGQKHLQKRPLNPFDYSKVHCSGMSIIQPRSFFPMSWSNAVDLMKKHLDSYWDERFKNSYVVHFYETSSQKAFGKYDDNNPKVLRPNNYGKYKPALAYIGPTECPMSFFSSRQF